MATFTSSLPPELLKQLSQKAKELKVPKNKLIEKALILYLEHITRAEYIKSYRRMNDDEDVLLLEKKEDNQ